MPNSNIITNIDFVNDVRYMIITSNSNKKSSHDAPLNKNKITTTHTTLN